MSNPDTILFSGTGELSETTVANLLTTEKYVTIEGYDEIAPNAFKDKTDILTVYYIKFGYNNRTRCFCRQ